MHSPPALLQRALRKACKIETSRSSITKSTADQSTPSIPRIRSSRATTASVNRDDHLRVGYMETLPNAKKEATASSLHRAPLYFESRGVTVQKLLTDNSSAYRSDAFKAMREAFGLKHSRTRPYRPRMNGKAKRLIQTALREWAYGPTWQSSDQRNQALEA